MSSSPTKPRILKMVIQTDKINNLKITDKLTL
jgi:hypothetical protein